MTESTVDLIPTGPRRCAELSRELGTALAGTAGSVRAYLVVPWPLPWPSDAGAIPALASLKARAKHAGARIQLVEPLGDAGDAAAAAVRLFVRSDPFTGFTPFHAPVGDVLAQCEHLLAGDGVPLALGGIDVLVCAHGTRDVCCGSLGARLLQSLPPSDSSTRWWRTSHLGGHRFAPTALSLPDGMLWGRLDAAQLELVGRRDQPVDALAGHVRGCSAFDADAAQVLDARAFLTRGWEWLATARVASTDGTRVQLTATSADGRREQWDGIVVAGRRLPQLPCRAVVDTVQDWDVELDLAAFRCAPVAPG